MISRRKVRNIRRTRLRGLRLESLETCQLLDASGLLWTVDSRLSLSFPAEGTAVGNFQNELSSHLQHLGNELDWQTEIRKGFQTWAQHLDLDIASVSDDGSDLGTPGSTTGDDRFGDVRVVAIPMESNIFATSIPTDEFMDGSWAGDILFNSNVPIESLDDLFAITLHEAGHVLGLEHRDDETSPLREHGIPAAVSATEADIAALTTRYPIAQPDSYEEPRRNGKPHVLEVDSSDVGLPTIVYANLHEHGDVDRFEIEVDDVLPLEVRLLTDEISSLQADFVLRDSRDRVLGRSRIDPATGEQTLLLLEEPESEQTRTHKDDGNKVFLDIQSNMGAPFGVGSYTIVARHAENQLDAEDLAEVNRIATLRHRETKPDDIRDYFASAFGKGRGRFLLDKGNGPNSEPAELELRKIDLNGTHRYARAGTLTEAESRDRLVVEVPEDAQGMMTASLVSLSPGFRGTFTVETINRIPIAVQPIVNSEHSTVLQISDVEPGERYVLRVQPHERSVATVGNYQATVQFNGEAATVDEVVAGELTAELPQQQGELRVDRTQIFRIGLTSVDDLHVLIAIRDSVGELVAELESTSELNTRSLMLGPGTYEALIKSPKELTTPTSFQLSIEAVEEPLGVEPIDPTEAPFFGWDWIDDLVDEVLLAADLNGDGAVTFADFLLLARCFGKQNATPEEGDFNGDKTVDFTDFLTLSRDYGKTIEDVS